MRQYQTLGVKIKPNRRYHEILQPLTDRQLMGTSHFPTFEAAFLDLVLDPISRTQPYHPRSSFKRNNGLSC